MVVVTSVFTLLIEKHLTIKEGVAFACSLYWMN